jgi:uncharacterized membrane-anchored protein YhcB (DUF1043 family)
MDTQTAFGLGMLVVVAIGMLIAIVIGMLKVSNLEAELADTQTSITKYLENIERHLSDLHRGLDDRISKEIQYLETNDTSNLQHVHRRMDDIMSEIDSRFDKFENRITKKQILKD